MNFAINDYIKINNTNIYGKIKEISNSKVTVEVNNKVLKVEIGNISKMSNEEIKKANEPMVKYKYAAPKPYTFEKKSSGNDELNIRHKDSITAMQEVEKFLDNAYINRITQVRVIHGKKGGILKAALYEILDSHPNVKSYEYADYFSGQNGVTVIKLKIMN